MDIQHVKKTGSWSCEKSCQGTFLLGAQMERQIDNSGLNKVQSKQEMIHTYQNKDNLLMLTQFFGSQGSGSSKVSLI